VLWSSGVPCRHFRRKSFLRDTRNRVIRRKIFGIGVVVLLSALISLSLGTTTLGFLPYELGILVLVYLLPGLLGFAFARMGLRPEYREVRFSAPISDPHLDESSE